MERGRRIRWQSVSGSGRSVTADSGILVRVMYTRSEVCGQDLDIRFLVVGLVEE